MVTTSKPVGVADLTSAEAGPATAKTAEEHGLHVDVLASEASTESLVQALAEYGSGLRRTAAESGEPVLRPSQRKGATRRKAK